MQGKDESRKKRKAEGIAAANARGMKFGRPEKEVWDDFEKIVHVWKQKRLSFDTVLNQRNMSVACFRANCGNIGFIRDEKTEIIIMAMSISKGVSVDKISPITFLCFTIRKAFMYYNKLAK